MRITYGEGVVVAILLPFVLLLLGLVRFSACLFLILLLFGVWTIVSAFALAIPEERNFYIMWGIILSCASTIFVIPVSYAIALILIAIIASVFLYVSTRKSRF
jgi:hypothetical protein